MKKIIFCLALLVNLVYSQAPNISYATPNIFTLNQVITNVIPTNTGGTIVAQTLVSTLAGSGSIGSTDANGILASFNLPTVVALDSFGNIFVVDRSNHKIRKITSDGTVTTFAGSGVSGAADGIGTAASFRFPDGAAFDSQNNLFISDQSNHKIRKITPDGTVSTFAGNGIIGAADGIGTAASFYYPAGMTVDANDNLLIADYGNNKIRKITPDGIVTTFAGSGVAGMLDGTTLTAQFNGATGVCVDNFGTIFVADYSNNKIRKINPLGIVSTVAGTGAIGSTDGNGAAASFYQPAIIAIDSNQNLFITDEGNHKIRKITPEGTVSTYAGTGSPGTTDGLSTLAQFNSATGVAVDASHNVYVCDYGNNKIRKIKNYGYSIFPQLPAGLNFDTATGSISGTPTGISPSSDYTIIASNSDGESSFVVTISVENELGLPDFVTSSIRIYPNPAKDFVTISASKNISKMAILNLLGQELLSKTNLSSEEKIAVSGLANGWYLLQTTIDNRTKTTKFLKQ